MSKSIYIALCVLTTTSFTHATHYQPRPERRIDRTLVYWECPSDVAPVAGGADRIGKPARTSGQSGMAPAQTIGAALARMSPNQSRESLQVALDQLQKLINSGADVNALNLSGLTPLILAIDFDTSPEAVKILIKGGADILKKDSHGKLPIEHVQSRIERKQKQLQDESKKKNPNKEAINYLEIEIENLYEIGRLVSPTAPAPAAPSAPTPAVLRQAQTAGATPQSSTTNSDVAPMEDVV